MIQHNGLLQLLHKFEELFDGNFATWKTYKVGSEIKKDARSIYLQPYPITKLHE